jgi:hypothetical protein
VVHCGNADLEGGDVWEEGEAGRGRPLLLLSRLLPRQQRGELDFDHCTGEPEHTSRRRGREEEEERREEEAREEEAREEEAREEEAREEEAREEEAREEEEREEEEREEEIGRKTDGGVFLVYLRVTRHLFSKTLPTSW